MAETLTTSSGTLNRATTNRDTLVAAILMVVLAAGLVPFLADVGSAEDALPAMLAGAILSVAAGRFLKYALRTDAPLTEVSIFTYALVSILGTAVLADNYTNTGLHFSTSFDDSFYWFNTRQLAEYGTESTSAWTLFELSASVWYRGLEIYAPVTPAAMLPFNWMLTAICVCLMVELTRVLVGRVPTLASIVLTVACNIQFFLVVSYFYRDIMVTLGFVGAVLFTLRRQLVIALLFAAVAGATRGAHGILALFVVMVVWFVYTDLFRRHKAFSVTAGVSLFVILIGLVAVLPASVLSGRRGEEESQTVLSQSAERQRSTIDYYRESESSSLGAQVIALGPVGIPLRMVSGYFAPITLRSPQQDRTYNSLFLPATMGDYYGVRGYFWGTFVSWATVFTWPFVAPRLILGLRRLSRGTTVQKTLFWSLIGTFLAVMVISMQERHRAPVLAFNILFLTLAERPTPAERRLRGRLAILTTIALAALNAWVYRNDIFGSG